jgi:putative Mg2+ transporter-C (MgtC) family protein
MTWVQFIVRLMLAQLLGAAIGVERQWRQRMAGLRTNALVATGAALFVMLGSMIPGVQPYPSRFLCCVGDRIPGRRGDTTRGLHGSRTQHRGHPVVRRGGGLFGRLGFPARGFDCRPIIIAANVLLRPLAMKINRQPLQNTEVQTHYTCLVVCRSEDEAHVRTLLLYGVNNTAMTLPALDREEISMAATKFRCRPT